jgi:hypothetical protein
MASENIPVETKSLEIVSVKINIYQLVLYNGFKCVVYQYDSQNGLVQAQEVEISGEEYNSWTSDDDMTTLILSKCGLVKKTSDPGVEVVEQLGL